MEATIKQQALMELAGLTSLDIADACDHYQAKYGIYPTFEQAYYTLSSMRMTFANIFMEELAKLKVAA